MARAEVVKDAAPFQDTPGPNLVLEIAGKAHGTVVIDLLPKVAPKTVAQIEALAKSGAYDDVVFHRVIDGFMAQTGDVQYGKRGGDLSRAGMGGSDLPNVPAEFSNV
ncbi:MAG: peptidylprolyl isomerase, partial [Paracoccaceae bacterium]|nr:peptidylprolyl isomerase [Paracoccaceae bacterium]